MKVATNKVVEIDYRLLVEGELVDQSSEGQPLAYLHGASNIIEGLENALDGKVVGDSFSVTIQPEEGYGPYDEAEIQTFDRSDFGDDMELEEGEEYGFPSNEGVIYPGRIHKLTAEQVWVDFNHPLAGKVLNFDVTVRNIRDASETELEHGHVHDGNEDEE